MNAYLYWFMCLACLTTGVGVGYFGRPQPKPITPPPAIPLYEIESRCRAQVRKEAAEAGVAYYELNQKTGEVEFHYVDIQRVIQQVAQQMQQRMQQVGPLQ